MSEIRKFVKSNLVLLLVILAGLIAAFSVIGARIGVESANKSYDIVLDYQELDALSRQSDRDVSAWLSMFRDLKITKVGLAEETLKSLTESDDLPVSAQIMGLVIRDAAWREGYPEEWLDEIDGFGCDIYDVMVNMRSKEAYDFVATALTERYDPGRIRLYAQPDGGYALLDGTPDMALYTERYKEQNSRNGGFRELIDITGSKLLYLSLGMLPEKVRNIQDLGMTVIPRTTSYNGWNDARYAAAVVADYARYGVTPAYVIVGGESVPGYDAGIDFIRDYLDDHDLTVGLIEDTTQLQNIMQYGVPEVTQATDYRTVRVFSVWDYIQNRYQIYGYAGAEEIENTLFRAVVERNIRVIYYKPIREFKDLHTYVTEPEAYREIFSNLETRLARHGIRYGDASVMTPYQVPFAAKILTALGAAAAGVLLLGLIFPMRPRVRYGLLAILAVCAVCAFRVTARAELIDSLANALIFACLAAVFATRTAKRRFDRAAAKPPTLGAILPGALLTLIGVIVIALLGGMMTAAPLSSVSYMLEIDIFRGVKVAQLLPILFFIVAYAAYFGFGTSKKQPGRIELRDVADMLNTPVKIWMILAGAVLATGGAYYILRTGHEFLQVSNVEMLFRNELEEILIARPRSKEFLFAFPSVMLMIDCAARRLKYGVILFGIGGTVGMTSVINTFMHLRTPLYLGFARTAWSALFGLIIGVVAVLIFDALWRLFAGRRAKRPETAVG